MKIGYARVSTFEQKLESQIEVLKEAGAEEVFQEKFTGTTPLTILLRGSLNWPNFMKTLSLSCRCLSSYIICRRIQK